MLTAPGITVTDTDLFRIQRCLGGARGEAGPWLLRELSRARVVLSSRVPPDVVTMNSRVLLEDVHTRRHREVTLVYPKDADPRQGKLSVLSAAGAALLGLTVGEGMVWPLPSGRVARMRLVEILYQPEAAGDFHL